MSPRVLCAVVFAVVVPRQLPAAGPASRLDGRYVQKLLRQLDHEDFHVRQKADEELRSLGTTVRSPVAAALGRTRSLEVRWRLGRILQEMTIDERVEVLVRLLADNDKLAQERAAWALRQNGPAVVPMLQKVMKLELPAEQRKRMEKVIAELYPAAP